MPEGLRGDSFYIRRKTLNENQFLLFGSILASTPRLFLLSVEDNDIEKSDEIIMSIISSGGGPPIKSFRPDVNVFPEGKIHWTPDGRGIAYIGEAEGTQNIYIQPADGSPARRLTSFTDNGIVNFSWSFDGKQIAYSRGKISDDIVMIQNLP